MQLALLLAACSCGLWVCCMESIQMMMMNKDKQPGKRPRKRKYKQMDIPFPPDPGQDAYVKKIRIADGGRILDKISKNTR
jgi:hypothetical protein